MTTTLDRIAALAEKHGLTLPCSNWVYFRHANRSGWASLEKDFISQGERLFWHESDSLPGLVSLFKPERVLAALEELDNDIPS